jgi:hypothetical protein
MHSRRQVASALRETEQASDVTPRRLLWTTDESQGPGRDFLGRISGSDWSRVVVGGPQIASSGLGFGWAVVDRHDSAGFWVRGVGAGGCRRLVVGLLGM